MLPRILLGAFLLLAIIGGFFLLRSSSNLGEIEKRPRVYQPRLPGDTNGNMAISARMKAWPPTSSLQDVADTCKDLDQQTLLEVDSQLSNTSIDPNERIVLLLTRASMMNYRGESAKGYPSLLEARALADGDDALAEKWMYTIIYFQGISSLRRGEDENCIVCRGESSCIIPVQTAAVHTNPQGSNLAIQHFMEYLELFPDDTEIRWLLNIAHMTLGQHPDRADPRFVQNLDVFRKSEFDIGRFRDVGHLVGVNRYNRQGGGILDDFDNDGLLDIVTTVNAPSEPMSFFRNKGDGTFDDRTKEAGLSGQLAGLYCVQADFNNDGFLDVFIPRGAWLPHPVRPSLMRNNGNGTFTDVTKEAGLLEATNSLTACWADFDNDGHIDLFLPGQQQRNRLYRNLGNGQFEEVAEKAGVASKEFSPTMWRSATWIDFDNDLYPDLFVNNLGGTATLYKNRRNGTFQDVTKEMGIDGPRTGFACWAWDYDNDGWLDIFATSYDRTVGDIVNGMVGKPHKCHSNKLYRNLAGKGFKDVTEEAGLDLVFGTMGCNFGDFDNDGFLDFYLGTGDPQLSMLVPNRMFKSVDGKRFAEITGTSGTGHLQKGHSVACGDWDRNGSLDIFIQMGGVIPGDQYHNILFQNPGTPNNWLNVKLVGKQTNRAAIGARIKLTTAGINPQTIYRYVTPGSSFGANPLEQLIGIGMADGISALEIDWPSGAKQQFEKLSAGRAIEIREDENEFRTRTYKPIPLPKP